MNPLPPDSATPESAQDTGAIGSPDFELGCDPYCPHCEYNLTGLTENRCPECGREFDPDDVAERCSLKPRPLRTWPDRLDMPVHVALVRTVTNTWFRPAQFARDYPFVHSIENAGTFSLLMKAVAFVLGAVNILAWMALDDLDDDILAWTFVVGFATVVASLVCELVLAGCFAGLLRPHGRPDAPRFRFWYGITLYTSSFLPLSVALSINVIMLFVIFIDPLPGAPSPFLSGLMIWGPVYASVGFWWFSLARMIMARGVGMRWLAILLIPVIGAGAVLLGVLLSAWLAFGVL